MLLIAWAAFLLLVSFSTFGVRPDGTVVYHLDLNVYRSAASSFVSGEGLYTHDYVVGPHDASLPFTYPPVAALFFIPLTWASYTTWSVIWTLGSYVAVCAVMLLVFRAQGLAPRHALVGAVVAGAVLVWLGPVRAHLSLGQVDLFLVVLVLADALLPRTPWPRGFLTGLSAAVKLTPLVFVLYFLVVRQRRAAVTTVVSACLFTALGVLVAPGPSLTYWSTLLHRSSDVRALSLVANWSVHGILEKVLDPPWLAVVWLVGSIVVVGIAFAGMVGHARRGQRLVTLAITALAMLLVAPVTWDHHYVWAVPMLAAFAMAAVRGSMVMGWYLALSLCLFMLSNATSELFQEYWAVYVVWALTTVGMCAVTVVEAEGSLGFPEGLARAECPPTRVGQNRFI